MTFELLEKVLLDLESMGSIKFGEFTLKSGLKSPVYFDLRLMVSKPSLMTNIAELLTKMNPSAVSASDVLCGVPYTALPLSTLMSVSSDKPMLIRRKEAKAYGTGQILEGNFTKGQKCLIIEDVITSGSSVLETAELLRSHGLKVDTAVVFLDREQGGRQILSDNGIDVFCVTDISVLMKTLLTNGRVKQDVVDRVVTFTANNIVKSKKTEELLPSVESLSFETRLTSTSSGSPVSRLFSVMLEKKSNLCVAADLASMKEIVDLVDKIGDKICCLKLHYDIVKDWTPESGKVLKDISAKFNFLLMEDRKFFDIGNTVKDQISSGPGCVSSWADFVTLVTMPGPAILDAVRIVRTETNASIGALIVAEMSSKDNYFTPDFSKKCVELMNKYPDVAVGLIAQSRLEKSRPGIIQMTPGVKIEDFWSSEGLGQQYISPESAVLTRGADVIIVGRGVTHAADSADSAEAYRKSGWEAYLKRVDKNA